MARNPNHTTPIFNLSEHMGLVAVLSSQFDIIAHDGLLVRRKRVIGSYLPLNDQLPAIHAAISASELPPADDELIASLCAAVAAVNLSQHVLPEVFLCQ